jgi:tripartite-type tricarboxylate transporter receptor subunit TctC
MVHVPYKGTAPALTGLIGGDIQILVDTPSSLMPHVRAGKIKALGCSPRSASPARRSPDRRGGRRACDRKLHVGDVPRPAGTPKEIVQRISAETAKIVNSPDMKSRFEQLGIEAVGNTPEQAAGFLNDEIAKWAKVINTAGVKAEQ